MSPTLERLTPEIDRLSFEEREELLEYLHDLDELGAESEETIRAAWEVEVEKRIKEGDAGLDESIPFEEAMEELRRKYSLDEPAAESEETVHVVWEAEIERRIEKCLSGQGRGVPYEELMEAMRRKYKIADNQIA